MTEQHICPECGDTVGDDDEFAQRADALFAALDGIDDPTMEMALISLVASQFLSAFSARERKSARGFLIRSIDEDTRSAVIAACDA